MRHMRYENAGHMRRAKYRISKTIRKASETPRKRENASAAGQAVLPLCLKVASAIQPILLVYMN